jgi:hypothetical protein
MLEHAKHRRFKIGVAGFPQGGFDLRTTGPLRIGQQRIEEGAARIGIDRRANRTTLS